MDRGYEAGILPLNPAQVVIVVVVGSDHTRPKTIADWSLDLYFSMTIYPSHMICNAKS